MYIYIYIYVCIHIYIWLYIYINMYTDLSFFWRAVVDNPGEMLTDRTTLPHNATHCTTRAATY